MKKTFIIFLIFLLGASLISCTAIPFGENEDQPQQNNGKPSIAGISLGDSKETVQNKLGEEYKVTYYDEAGHYPELFYVWEYEYGITVYIGKVSEKVLEIRSTAIGTETNLGIKVGDNAELVLDTYREKYTEPESIHGVGKLIGIFKVEEGTAMIFDFNIEDGIANPGEINSNDILEQIILTYPSHIEESF